MADWAKDSRADALHCPALPGGPNVGSRINRGKADAYNLAYDVRHQDLTEVWGRLNRWGKEDPARLLTACVTLAAMVPIDQDGLLTWTETLGGLQGLQPPQIPTMRGEQAA